MLGNPTPAPIIDIPEINVPIATSSATPTPIPTPAFTIPPTRHVPVQAVLQGTIPHKKNVGVKVFLFVIMFVGL